MLTCTAESIALVASVAGAGVAPLSVVAHCIGMAIVSPQCTLIHICNAS